MQSKGCQGIFLGELELGHLGGVVYAIYFEGSDEVLYVGSTQGYQNRKLQHISALRCGTHKNKALQDLFNRNPRRRMIFKILEVASPHENLRLFEQMWMNDLRPTCNEIPVLRKDRFFEELEDFDDTWWFRADDSRRVSQIYDETPPWFTNNEY